MKPDVYGLMRKIIPNGVTCSTCHVPMHDKTCTLFYEQVEPGPTGERKCHGCRLITKEIYGGDYAVDRRGIASMGKGGCYDGKEEISEQESKSPEED